MSTDDSASPDIAIIGGGIVGGFLAYYLARSGAKVEIVDPDPGGGASAGNAGILALSYSMPMSNPSVVLSGVKSLFGADPAVTLSRPLAPRTLGWLGRFALASMPGRARRDAPKIHALAIRSRALYDDFARDENIDLGLRRTGWLYVARDPKVLRAQERAARQLASIGVEYDLVDSSSLTQMEPAIGPAHVGGIHFANDVSLDPAAVTNTVLSAAVAHGAVLSRERVIGADRSGTRVRALRTNTGRRVHAGTVVIAAGGDSSEVAALLGTRVPIERGYGWSLVLPTQSPIARQALMGAEDHVVINPGPTTVRLTGGMQFGGNPSDSVPSDSIERLRASAEKVIPALGSISAAGKVWRGARPMTPSGMPFTRRLSDNIVAVTGHGTLGMTLGPASARDATALLTGAMTH